MTKKAFEAAILPSILPRGPLPDLNTPLGQWPVEWLQLIEPKIVRTTVGDGDHWLWTGYMKNQNNAPTISWRDPHAKCGMRNRSVRKMIGWMFWNIPDDARDQEWDVQTLCTFDNCLNPRHMAVVRKRGRNVR